MTHRVRTLWRGKCSRWRRLGALFPALTTAVLVVSCGTGPAGVGEERSGGESISRIEADAYLYDVRVYRDSKPTSIRLELFRADSIIGLNGRAYLGKGALKGRMTSDSLVLFFPTRNEYIAETLDDAAGASGCESAISGLRISRFLSAVPDSIILPEGVEIERTDSDEDHPAYTLSNNECSWKILLRYDLRHDAYSLKRFEFDGGDRLHITADRREFKPGAMIPVGKFQVQIPAEAARIFP